MGKRLKGAKFQEDLYPDVKLGQEVFIEDGYLDPLVKQIPDGYQFNPGRDYLLAVHVEQITLNPNLVQNPGWN